MSSIPLAALAVRTPKFEGPLDQMTKAVQLKSLLQRQGINEAYLQRMQEQRQGQQQAQQRAQEEQQRIQSLFRETEGDWQEFFKKAPGRGISMGTLLKLKESYRKDLQEYRAQSVEERATRKERMALYGNEVAAVVALPENQRKASFMQRVQALTTQGLLQPQQAQQFAQLAQLPDEEFNRQLELIRLSAIGATKLFDAEEKREARTVKEKDFQFWYKSELEALGLKRTAKLEQQKRAEYRKLDEKKKEPEKPEKLSLYQQVQLKKWKQDQLLRLREKYQFDAKSNSYISKEAGVLRKISPEKYQQLEKQIEDGYRALLKVGRLEVEEAAPAPAGAPPTKGKRLDAETARKILQEAGGDKNKAREIARQRGYIF